MPHDAFSSHEIAVSFVKNGASKCRSHPVTTFVRACFSGMFLGFGGALSTLIGGGTPGLGAENPALQKLLAGAAFPVGIIMTVLNSQELLTSNMISVPMAVMCKQARWYWIPFNWTLVFFGNFAGTLFWDALLVRYSAIFTQPYAAYAIKFATAKVVTPTWGEIFLRGIGCNVLVCLAVWQASELHSSMATIVPLSMWILGTEQFVYRLVIAAGAREVASKIMALWIPIFIFVALGFDHVVANMYFVPVAMMWGSPDITVGLYIWKSIIPSFLGNAVGALLVGIPYRYLFIDDLKVFQDDESAEDEELAVRRVRDVEKVHDHLQLDGRTPVAGRSRPGSSLGGGRTPSVKSAQ